MTLFSGIAAEQVLWALTFEQLSSSNNDYDSTIYTYNNRTSYIITVKITEENENVSILYEVRYDYHYDYYVAHTPCSLSYDYDYESHDDNITMPREPG